ncbi:MAG TPA: hypothetical protein VNY52_11495 [Solirubrobacteraceae bacterium]|nr:hypothetical protein [Solirubrobacteraceae bacterium]
MAALAVLVVLAWRPAVGSAEVINTSGPLTSIHVESDLGCQVQASGDIGGSFFPSSAPGACGTFLALTAGEDVGLAESHHLFGSNPPAGVTPEADFTPVPGEPQKLTGEATAANPFVVTTHDYAEEPIKGAEPFKVAEVTETDSYVAGQNSYETAITVKNLGDSRLEGTLYHAGDCYLANLDEGYGAENVPSAGSVACTINPNNSPPARFMAFTPTFTTGPSVQHIEGFFGTVWSYVTPTGTEFPDTVDVTTHEDNAMGLSWPINLNLSSSAENSATLKLTTTVLPSSAPSSSSSSFNASAGGACVSGEQFPVTISAANGVKAVHYIVDGGTEQTIETKEASQALIPLTPGQHTLEYWAEDLTGAQENPHNKVTVIAASGAPGLTITSEQGKNSYLVGETASVAIAATGLDITSNPSATKVAISTSAPGSFSVTRSATNPCGTTSASYAYTVSRNTLSTLPPPVLGKTVNVEPVSGEVFVKLPPGYANTASASLADPLQVSALLETAATESLSKGIGFIPLREARQIPVGSTLETTRGVARIATATATPGQQQQGDFGAGIFKLLQKRQQKGLTELDMIDNRSAHQVCATVGKVKGKGRGRALAAKHLSSKVLGRINASGHGHFTVRGQYSAATVRGTVWSVGDRCEGTLTQVKRGVVVVRDFRRRKTITLFTGQSYLAKAPHY